MARSIEIGTASAGSRHRPDREAAAKRRRLLLRSRATVALLLFALLALPACGGFASGTADRPDDTQNGTPERSSTVNDADVNRAAGGDSGEKAADASSEGSAQRAPDDSGTGGRDAGKRVAPASFVHRVAGENIRGDYTYVPDPSIDGDPEATVFVAPTAETARTFDRNIGVWFEPDRRQWAIFNQNRSGMPKGAGFEVVVPPQDESFVHRATAENSSGEGTFIDDSLVNGKPEVTPSVTQNWNPGGGDGVYNDHPIGVRYDAGRERWEVFNRDDAAMPAGASFNVTVAESARTTSADLVDVDTGAAPQYRNFYSEGNPETPKQIVSEGSSTGAIPVVQPFNFGRDPGGPKDKTLSLTIPRIDVKDIPVFDTVSEERLRDGTVHIPATGYPWQKGANVYIAGHRIGFENTLSYYVFFRLDELRDGDEIRLQDAKGREFVYRVSRTTVVGPDQVDVMNAVEDKSLVTLQTCTLPDYKKRLIVQGTLVERNT